MRLLAKSEPARNLTIQAYRLYARAMRFSPPPRVLVNSIPKAGTHLLVSLLKNVPRMMFAGRHHTFRHFGPENAPALHEQEEMIIDWDRLALVLRAVNNGQFMTGHFIGHERLFALLDNYGYKTILVLRDPRDIVVSSAFYFTREKRHYLHHRFNTELRTTEQRIMATIQGLPSTLTARGLEGIGGQIRRFMPWIDLPNTHICFFERLVGPQGGGCIEMQESEIRALALHLNRPMTNQDVRRAGQAAWSKGASTFRKGLVGDWRNHFTQDHVDAFKEASGRELVELGFESDHRWAQ